MDYAEVHWDAIVVGTGMGGATAGYALARGGKRVLFCERGLAPGDGATGLRGDYPENLIYASRQPEASHGSMLRRAGRHDQSIDDLSFDRPRRFVPFIGSGAGGSSALYGMALERFFKEDFEPRKNHPQATGAALPERWPVGFEEFEPYYARAEALYRVHRAPVDGDGDRFVPPNRELVDFLAGKGLHPYALPLACDLRGECRGCQGFLCRGGSKNDSAKICLAPAIERHGAHLLTGCTVQRLIADGRRVSALVCEVEGRELRLQADTILLAAGALATPRLLLESADEHWPSGLANRSGLVGRYLMRHCIDLYAIAVKSTVAPTFNLKQIAFNDFYVTPTGKFGSVQSFGSLPGPQMLVDSMQEEMVDEHGRLLGAAFGLTKAVLKPLLGRIFARRVILAAVMEDLPYADNRVTVARGTDGVSRSGFRYRLTEHDRTRVERFRSLMRTSLEPYAVMVMKQAENNRRLAHVCGTCRFGDDPAESVLNRDNRAHDLENLYVVDASFFPSSGGTNPALTVAANALRVADHLLQTTSATV